MRRVLAGFVVVAGAVPYGIALGFAEHGGNGAILGPALALAGVGAFYAAKLWEPPA